MKTMRLPFGLAVGVMCAIALGIGQRVQAQTTYEPNIRVPVTFYDFHSDRSNPEFEQPHDGNKSGNVARARVNMVDSLLDADGKPKLGRSPYLNHGVRFWFRDWSKLNDATVNKMRDSTYVVGGATRNYLDKFRPVYMYDNNRYPPYRRQHSEGNPESTRWGASEWSSNPANNQNAPYAYAGGTFTVNGQDITANANGFTMNQQYYTVDSAYKNIVVPDTLTFDHVNNGVYQFIRNGTSSQRNNQFFPLNGKGFQANGATGNNWIFDGSNGGGRNYAYTMELVWEFRYIPGQAEFSFLGDDDVWVFVDNKLVMDIGGIHEPVAGTFNLDNLISRGVLNLAANDKTTMRMFYCERHANDANIQIMTNIITTVPNVLSIDVTCDELIAGVPCEANGVVYDNDGNRTTDFSNGTFTWTAADVTTGGPFNTPGVSQSNAAGTLPATGDIRIWKNTGANTLNKSDSIYLVANKAYTWVTLKGEYCSGGKCVEDTTRLYVKPGPASKLFIEASADSLASLRDSAPLRYITMTATDNSNESFYAILRDAFGNWVRPAGHNVGGSSNEWSVTRPSVAGVANGTNTARGQGRATRVSTVADTTPVSVTHTASNLFTPRPDLFTPGTSTPRLTANSVIRLVDIDYIGIRVGVKVGSDFYQPPGDSILMYIPGDTTLYVQFQRSDNGAWEEAPANWSAERIRGDGSAPTGIPVNSSYNYNPAAPVEIRLIVTNTNGTLADTIRINAKYQNPVAMRFFNKSEAPTDLDNILPVNSNGQRLYQSTNRLYRYPVSNDPAPTTVVIPAGENLPIAAAMFGTNPPAPNSYIPSNNLPGDFEWEIVNNTDEDATKITASSLGDEATFRSTLAWQTHVVRATYTPPTGTPVVQELRVQVIPGAPDAVYIEPESQELTRSSMNKPLTFTGRSPVLGNDGVITELTDTLYLANTETSRQVYALLRDKWGNYIAPSGGYNQYWSTYIETPKPTTWSQDDNSVVTAAAGSNPSMGQGIVTNTSTEDGVGTFISAREETFPLGKEAWKNPARLRVEILGYSYTELRIVVKPPYADSLKNGTLRITTNDEPTLVVEGKRSDCGQGNITGEACWEEVTGIWGRDDGLGSSLQSPPSGSSWKLDPRRTGEGNITVSRQGVDEDGNITTISTELPTVIKLGPPTSAELSIISSPTTAGEDIKAEVRYYNRTGLMTEWDPSWNGSGVRAAFNDNRGLGNTTVKPSITSDCNEKQLGYSGNQSSANACLAPSPNTGRDTVTLILYNATDNPHTITYTETIQGVSLTASANLTLRPGEPVRVIIEVDGTDKDSITLDHGEVVILQTIGVDEWGNKTGDESSKWCSSGSIPPSGATCDTYKPTIIYDSDEAAENGCGRVIATPEKIIGDTLNICIEGVKIKPISAVTRDYDGDGYLDVVEVLFASEVKLKNSKFDVSKHNSYIELRYNHRGSVVKFTFSNVTVKDNVVSLFINESESKKQTSDFETGWRPVLGIHDGLIENVDFIGLEVRDGAAPVIAVAKRYFDKNGRKELDYIEVTFSEKIWMINGKFSDQNSDYAPKKLFYIWELDNSLSKVREKKLSKSAKTAEVDTKRYKLLPTALNNIGRITYGNDSTLTFFLENEYDLKPPSHYINIVADANETVSRRSEIRDGITPANIPDTNNRKAPITYANEPADRMIPVPNPASPDKSVVGNSDEAKNPKTGKPAGNDAYKYIGAYHNPNAIQHIRNGGGGAVFQVPVYIARSSENGPPDKIMCQVKVYDLAGNLVSSGKEEDLLRVPGSDLSTGSDTYTHMDMFWTGYNSKGMKSAPGTYRIIVQLSYPDTKDPKAKNKKYTGTIGIAK